MRKKYHRNYKNKLEICIFTIKSYINKYIYKLEKYALFDYKIKRKIGHTISKKIKN